MPSDLGAPLLACILIAAPNLLIGQDRASARQEASTNRMPPVYHISFERGEPLAGLKAAPVFLLPFQCREDGTVFVGMFDSAALISPADLSAQFLAAIPLSGEVQRFRLPELPNLHDVSQVSRYVSDSGVAILVRATPTPPVAQGVRQADPPEYHDYIVTLDRKGEYQDTIQVQGAIHAAQVAVFPSGNLLLYGFDDASRAPKLVILTSGGSLLKEVRVGTGAMRKSALDKGPTGEGPDAFVSPVQFVPQPGSIILLQANTDLPLIEVTEGGEAKTIRPKLPPNAHIGTLVPSDRGLFVRVAKTIGKKDTSIYEIDPHTGRVIRALQLGRGEGDDFIACVHEGQFLSFEHDSEGGHPLIPLRGAPEPGPAPRAE